MAATRERCALGTVSVLFSEPKIPQLGMDQQQDVVRPQFQCSSASRKFLNFALRPRTRVRLSSFSALQRAENSQYKGQPLPLAIEKSFSALQRAENSQYDADDPDSVSLARRFSALQRAENSQCDAPGA